MESYKMEKPKRKKRMYKTIYMKDGDPEAFDILKAHGINLSDFLRYYVHEMAKELQEGDNG